MTIVFLESSRRRGCQFRHVAVKNSVPGSTLKYKLEKTNRGRKSGSVITPTAGKNVVN
jgi:hypothetical protein